MSTLSEPGNEKVSNTTGQTQEHHALAKKRWKILANSLRKKSVYIDSASDCSVRRFEGFKIFDYKQEHEDSLATWFSVRSLFYDAVVKIRYATIDDLFLLIQGVPKKVSIKNFYSELLTTSIHSF